MKRGAIIEVLNRKISWPKISLLWLYPFLPYPEGMQIFLHCYAMIHLSWQGNDKLRVTILFSGVHTCLCVCVCECVRARTRTWVHMPKQIWLHWLHSRISFPLYALDKWADGQHNHKNKNHKNKCGSRILKRRCFSFPLRRNKTYV